MIIKLLNKANECIETDFAGRASLWRNLKELMSGQTSFFYENWAFAKCYGKITARERKSF